VDQRILIMKKYIIKIESQTGEIIQEHIVSQRAAQTLCDYVNNNGYASFNNVKSIEVQPYV